MSIVNGRKQISTSHSSKISELIGLKLKFKFGEDRNKGVGVANTQLVTTFGSTLCWSFVCLCILIIFTIKEGVGHAYKGPINRGVARNLFWGYKIFWGYIKLNTHVQ